MDEIEDRLERIEGAIASLARSVDARFDAIERRLTEVEHRLSAISDSIKSISDRLGRQVAVTEALRSDVRLFASVAQGMLGAVQGFAAAYADLSGRVTDLENRG